MPKFEINPWTLDEALKLIRTWQSIAWENNFHIALAGSVLNHGFSTKDLDIIVMSMHNGKESNWEEFADYLRKQGDFFLNTPEHYILKGREMYKLNIDGRMIDIFRYDI